MTFIDKAAESISSNLDDSDISSLKKVLAYGAVILVVIWAILLSTALLTAAIYKPEELGQVGDAMNIMTSLTGVFSVVLLAYAVYLQKTELKEVREQIAVQTKSTEEEQRKNRTFKKLEEWDDAVAFDDDFREFKKLGLSKIYPSLIKSRQWTIVERLVISSRTSSPYLNYFDLYELQNYIALSAYAKYLIRINSDLTRLYKNKELTGDGVDTLIKIRIQLKFFNNEDLPGTDDMLLQIKEELKSEKDVP